MDKTSELLRSRDIKVTPQRLGVYMAFKGKEHLSADEIFQRVRRTVPAISLATVYAILENFAQKDLVQEVRIDDERTLFEKREDSHHHFLCRGCDTVFDVDLPGCMAIKSCEVDGHKIEEFQGYFYGICKQCQGPCQPFRKRKEA